MKFPISLLGLWCALAANVALAIDNTEIDPELFVPEVTRIVNDEFVASVFFTPGFPASSTGVPSFPPRVESFLIEWGPVGQDFPFTIRQNKPEFQMQLLEDGIEYRGRIFALGKSKDGRRIVKSNAKPEFFFRSDSTRVNALRASSSFFDSFNEDASDFDERRWNVASEVCGDSETANFNLNAQKHVHHTLGARSNDCRRESISAKARGRFNFQGRTGKINVDVDGGEFPGHKFFIDIGKKLGDSTAFGAERSMVRILLENSRLQVHVRDAEGKLLPTAFVNLFLRDDNTLSVANVRKPWEISISQSAIAIKINGIEVLESIPFPQQLDFEVADVRLTQLLKKSRNGGHHVTTFHLDNFGFDGPAQTRQVLNYRNPEEKVWKEGNSDWTITIPDEETVNDQGGVKSLRFTRQFSREIEGAGSETLEPGSGLRRRAGEGDVVIINGREVAIPRNPSNIFDIQNVVVDLESNDIKETNNIVVETDGFIGNMHMEFDYSCNNTQNRTFTPPVSQCMHALNGFPMSFACDRKRLARPNIAVKSFNLDIDTPSTQNVLPLIATIDMFTGRQLRHNGGSNGLKSIDVLVDCEIQKTIDLGGAGFEFRDFKVPFTVNIGVVSDVWFRVLDNAGRASTLGQRGLSEEYRPFKLALGNEGGGPAVCEKANIGGECTDECVTTKGIESKGVCPNSSINRVTVRGQRPPLRSEMYDGYRHMWGDMGNWGGDERENPSFQDANAPAPGDRTLACQFDNCNEGEEFRDSGVIGLPTQTYTESSWIDRDVVPDYLLVTQYVPEDNEIASLEREVKDPGLELVWVDRETGDQVGIVEETEFVSALELSKLDLEARTTDFQSTRSVRFSSDGRKFTTVDTAEPFTIHNERFVNSDDDDVRNALSTAFRDVDTDDKDFNLGNEKRCLMLAEGTHLVRAASYPTSDGSGESNAIVEFKLIVEDTGGFELCDGVLKPANDTDDLIIFIAAGAGGGVVFIFVLILICVKCRRRGASKNNI